MPVPQEGAQRASGHRIVRLLVCMAIAAAFATSGLAARPTAAVAAQMKVVVVVGPAGGATSGYISSAKKLASQARSYGAKVTELYSPHATWSKVKSAAQGANLLIYLGHGNGYPSPYGAFNAKTKDGMGLNSKDGSSAHTYYGEYYVDRDIQLAKNAVVILNRLCYASGNNEWGSGYPSKSTAIQRVDNYGAGFLRANAQAVFAEGIDGTVVHPARALHDEPDDARDLLDGSGPGRPLGLLVQLEADAGLHRDDGPARRCEPLLPLGGREPRPDGDQVAQRHRRGLDGPLTGRRRGPTMGCAAGS